MFVIRMMIAVRSNSVVQLIVCPMNILSTIVMGIVLSGDSFAAAMCQGSLVTNKTIREVISIGCIFGLVEASAVLCGWSLGYRMAHIVRDYDHWITFILLLGLGCQMIYATLQTTENKPLVQVNSNSRVKWIKWLLLSLSTSVDAILLGISLALFETKIYLVMIVVGCFTFVATSMGSLLGGALNKHGCKMISCSSGLGLILMGIMTLFGHFTGR